MLSEEGSMDRDPFLDERGQRGTAGRDHGQCARQDAGARTLRNRTTGRRTLRGDCYPHRYS
jgi:hypothetical protein